MEVKIGVQHAPRELILETDQAAADLEGLVAQAVSAGTVLSLTDTKNRTFLIPGDRIAYVEIGSGVIGQVGFRH
ncbi:MAG TPA: DUF3107 domain-containing protein [Nocardioides sp.]|uniref:DUF3107 domain-containing protein n=1 Tax=Nocardioides sp. TaxID=35761 RepID=UPI002BBECCB3|nr:DUF3107 domain-containing protein [Nocardioides sp.]HQR27812.1 DUF3107 domain-containing protein [Nocardioides sp.]